MASKRAARQRWSDVPSDEPISRVRRQRIVGDQAMISRFELDAGSEVPSHAYENGQLAYVISGRVRFVVDDDGEELVLTAGEALQLPSMAAPSAQALEDSVVLDVFAPPSEVTGGEA